MLNFNPTYPATDSAADQALVQIEHAKFNLWFVDPISGKGYPQDAWDAYGADVPVIAAGDMAAMTAPLDFLGVNYYSRKIVHDPAGSMGTIINRPNPINMMARAWEVAPQALVELMQWLRRDYDFPAYLISENGATYDDVVWEGRVHDLQRIDYIKQHLAVLPGLIAEGIPLKGYFCWSLMDNFEWATGTRDRFGLAYTDFATQQRIVKDSGYWYSRVIKANAVVD